MRYLSFSLATLLLTTTSLSVFAQEAPSTPYMLRELDKPRRSTGMMITGIVLTSIASLALVGGVVVTAIGSREGGNGGGILAAVVGLPMIGGSTIFAGVGIPLWVVGASTPKPRHAEAIPRLSVGAGSGALRWTF